MEERYLYRFWNEISNMHKDDNPKGYNDVLDYFIQQIGEEIKYVERNKSDNKQLVTGASEYDISNYKK